MRIDRITAEGIATEHSPHPTKTDKTACGVPLDTPGCQVIPATGRARPCNNCRNK